MQMQWKAMAAVVAAACAGIGAANAESASPDPGEAAFRELYKELIEINTTRSVGDCTRAVEAMRQRLRAAGFPAGDLQILAPPEAPKDGALVAVLRGSDSTLKPILLLAHIDVVEAKREDWVRDPFKLVEEDGWFYARGASDDKAMAAIFTDSLIRYRQQGYTPRRDIKLALTCGEETAGAGLFDSVRWLVQTQPGVLAAEFVINEGAGGEYDEDGRPIVLQVQAGEKVYQDFQLEVTDPGGHSSLPKPDNAIVRLSRGLARLGVYQFPVVLNPVTRAYFESMAKLMDPAIGADMRAVLESPPDAEAAARLWARNPLWNAMLRTTCIVSEIQGGHAPNAIPQHVKATVNCRILPDTPVADVQAEIARVLADDAIRVSTKGEGGVQAPIPPLTEEILGPARQVAGQIWPGVTLVPFMLPGYTDGKYLNAAGIPTYGISGLFETAEGDYVHGLNERMNVQALMDGRRFLHEVVKLYADGMRVERDVAVPMRDGVALRADVYRPAVDGKYPVLVFRTPYGKHFAARSDGVHRKAVERGYVAVLQDVRGRYASDGIFNPYRQEGADGYDTIEWAAAQSWSDGRVGTYGLSYPGAVQWLAAMEKPPHLLAMAPAMTFSSPRRFFYMSGIFDRSWLPWIYQDVAPDARRRLGMPVGGDAEESWRAVADEFQSFLPLRDLPWLRREAPYYFEWLAHPPEDPWWDWAELRGRYDRVAAAVLNLSGWYDDAYGVEGAATNHKGLAQARGGQARSRTHLVLGPWVHGAPSTMSSRAGELDFGANAAIGYDELVLDFHDHYIRGVANRFATEPPVRYFVMGANEWRDARGWPPPASRVETLYLHAANDGGTGRLQAAPAAAPDARTVFTADPKQPVADPHGEPGAHDYRALAAREDVLSFDTEPLAEDLWVSGNVTAEIHASCDCRDFDLWVRLQDVHPDGSVYNLMGPGNDVVRASYRDPAEGRQPLEPGQIYELRVPTLMTANRFGKGHRMRVQISASFDPHLSRNLQTGESEVVSAESRAAEITIHHGAGHASRLVLPIAN